MTFSLCVHEPYRDDEGNEQHRFGVAVTTRLVGVGTLCPFASEHGAVATQSLVNVELGRRGLKYLEDGLAVADALEAGHEAGGDKREELTVQSAALVVEDTEERPFDRAYTDLRVDATETPIADLRTTYEMAVEGHRDAMAKYEDAYKDDEMSGTSGG